MFFFQVQVFRVGDFLVVGEGQARVALGAKHLEGGLARDDRVVGQVGGFDPVADRPSNFREEAGDVAEQPAASVADTLR